MGNWGISENASAKEKIKSEMADYLNGLNSCGEININLYDEIFDFSMNLLEKMYEQGMEEADKRESENDNTGIQLNLDRRDLMALVKNTSPLELDTDTNPILKKAGTWSNSLDRIDRWCWNEYVLQKMDDKQLFEIYKICKDSWKRTIKEDI